VTATHAIGARRAARCAPGRAPAGGLLILLCAVSLAGAGCGTAKTPIPAASQPAASSAELPASATPAVGTAALLDIKGTGNTTSQEFKAAGTSVNVTYSYTCPSEGSFTVNFYGTNGSPLLPDVITDEFGASGGSTVNEQPNGMPSRLKVEVVTTCSWTVKVEGAP